MRIRPVERGEAPDVVRSDGILSDAQVVELVLTIATANWTNRVNDGLQTPLR
jgi:alkylhydroperoxidase family enzyme